MGDGWAARECPPEPPEGCGGEGGRQESAFCDGESLVLGQVVSAREYADLLALLRLEEELEAFTLGTGVGLGLVGVKAAMEIDDPFGHTGFDFDSP